MNGGAVEIKLEEFRGDVASEFARVREELKELTKALRDLIRIEGDIRRIQDTIERIGDEVKDHEKRLRAVEVSGIANNASVKHLDRWQWLALTAVTNGLTAFLVYQLTH